ncbi:hypothetical protein HT031_005817 [Scenedesmus sp. PABB004]|nr:hypothetical protein HT031_005817 [Scenedesmus sp. PABB004]
MPPPPPAADDPLPGLLAAVPDGLLLLRDSGAASGSFLLPWLAAAALSQGGRVVVVAAAASPAKYAAALRKLGAPLAGRVAFAAPALAEPPARRLRALLRYVLAHARGLLAPEQQQQGPAAGAPEQQQREAGERAGALTVIVDSLPCLSCLAGDGGGCRGASAALVHQLAALGEALQSPCRVVLLAAGDVAADAALVAAAAARAGAVADVAPLEGRTAGLDGSLTITVRRAPAPPRRARPSQQQEQGQQGRQQLQRQAGDLAARVWLPPGGSERWFFRAGDVGVRWLRAVGGRELMAAS